MRNLIVTAFVSLDGVMEAPGGEPGYRNTGWTFKDIEFDPEAYEIKGREQEEAGALLFGRELRGVRAGVADHDRGLRRLQRDAAVRRLDHPGRGGSRWPATILRSLDDVAALKQTEGGPIIVNGSAKLGGTWPTPGSSTATTCWSSRPARRRQAAVQRHRQGQATPTRRARDLRQRGHQDRRRGEALIGKWRTGGVRPCPDRLVRGRRAARLWLIVGVARRGASAYAGRGGQMTTSSGRTVPFLSAGAHLSAEEGMCLMEAVSRAARLPWSDEPACTHHLLAHLARVVNDASTDDGRQQLEALVTDLASSAPGDAAHAAAASARVAVACTEVALEFRASPLLNHLHRVAEAQVARESRYSSGGPGRFRTRPPPYVRARTRRARHRTGGVGLPARTTRRS